jgi:ABC-type amino acid transport substrate-binding protein
MVIGIFLVLILLFVCSSIYHISGFQENITIHKEDSRRRKFFHFGIQGLLMSAGAEHFVFSFRSIRMQLLSLVVYFFGMTFVAGFFGLVAATFTQSMNDQPHYTMADIESKKVAALGNSTAEILLSNQLQAKFNELVSHHASLEQALDTLAKGDADLVLGDWAQLIYFTHQNKYKNKLYVQNNSFQFEPYGWGLTANSPWREPINQELIAFLRHPEWKRLVHKYMGDFEMIF